MKSRSKKPIKSEDSFRQSQNDLAYTHSPRKPRNSPETPNIHSAGALTLYISLVLFNSFSTLYAWPNCRIRMKLPGFRPPSRTSVSIPPPMLCFPTGMLDFSTYTNFGYATGGRGCERNEKWQRRVVQTSSGVEWSEVKTARTFGSRSGIRTLCPVPVILSLHILLMPRVRNVWMRN